MKRILGLLFIFMALGLSVTMLCSCDANPETCEHDYGAWIVTISPTCERYGEQKHTCSKCGKTDTRIMGKTQHDYKQVIVKVADCTNSGQIDYICSYNPKHNYSEYVEALGHDWITNSIKKAPTCEADGLSGAARCDRCGLEEQSVVLPKLGHKYIEKSRTEATCEGTGTIHYVCEHDEKHTKDEIIEALGHDWDVGNVEQKATCTSSGWATGGKCRRCQQIKGRVEIPALGHDMRLIDTKPIEGSNPNENLCGGAGIQTWKCSRCEETYTKRVEGTNHTFSNRGWFIRKKATCQQSGENFRRCMVCNYEEVQTIEKLPHDYSKIEYIKAPTCETAGTMKMKCSMCGQYETGHELVAEPTGHEWKELGVTKLPTCQTKGQASHKCLTCGVTKEYTIDTCDHVYKDYYIDAGGQTMSKHCVYCGKESKTEQKPIPKVSNGQVEYELRLRRTNGIPYIPHKLSTGFENLEYKIFDENNALIQTIQVNKDTLSISLSSKAKKLQVVGLPEGFKSVEIEYFLDSSKPLVTIEVKAEIVKSFDPSKDKFAKAPQKSLFIGDVMHDFWVEDIRDSNRSNYLSEILKEKKFIFLDFFHINCSWCTHHTKQFMYTYERDMYKYHDDILVILVDVHASDSIDGIKNYCSYNKIPDDFMVCKTADYVENDVSVGHSILSWFEANKGIILGTPGHVWLDSEGVIYSMTKCTSENAFRDMINGYFEKLYIGEAAHEYLDNVNKSYKSKQMPISFESFCLPHQNVFENKRKYIN